MSDHQPLSSEVQKPQMLQKEGSNEVCIDCQDAASSLPINPTAMDTSSSSEAGPSRSPAASTSRLSSAPSGLQPVQAQELVPAVVIEFCDRCRWAPRATWTMTELLLTFPTPILRSIRLVPLTNPDTAGRFRVWCDPGDLARSDQQAQHAEGRDEKWHLLWDRKTEGGFPELKVLKQRLRDLIQPEKKLGHSDAHPPHRSTSTSGIA